MFFVANSRAHVWAHFAAPGQASTSKTTMIFHNLTPKFDSKLYFRLSIRAHRLSAQRSDPHPNSRVQFLDHTQLHPAKPIRVELRSSCPSVTAWQLPEGAFFQLCVIHGESQGNGRSRCFDQLQENQTNRRRTRTPALWEIN